MNQNNKLEKSSTKHKDPYLKLRYARGAGDVLACFLHSKPIGWLTKLITGKDKPCSKCFKRGNALNVLFPIKVWKLFFKSEDSYINELKKDLEKAGYLVSGSSEGKAISTTKIERISSDFKSPFQPLNQNESPHNNFILLASSDNYVGDFLIKTEVFKVK